MTTEPTTVKDELDAMSRMVATLDKLDPAAQDRVVGWLYDCYRLPAETVALQEQP